MKQIAFEDIAPFLVRERRSHEAGELRARQIAAFLNSEQRCQHVDVILRGTHAAGPNVGSSTQFDLYFDHDWSPVSDGRYNQRRRYTVSMAVSERGPFVVSFGSEWVLAPADWAGGLEKLQPRESPEAETKARILAVAVASKFNLTYLDVQWLRQFKLSDKELPEEVRLSLDYSEPDALNVLFDETL